MKPFAAVNRQPEFAGLEPVITESMRVTPQIGLLNKYVQKVKKVAISAIDPIYSETHQLRGFNVQIEGPAKHMSYLARLLSDANLKVS